MNSLIGSWKASMNLSFGAASTHAKELWWNHDTGFDNYLVKFCGVQTLKEQMCTLYKVRFRNPG